MRARQYNPTLARWTAQDPMAEKYYGISPYMYCAGNPINMVDVNGEEGLVVSGSPGNHKNREHFLINGLNRALNIKGKTKNAEKVTWIVYNDKKNGYDRKTLDTYFAKAKKQGINTIEFSESKDIVDYVNIKEGNNSRDEDKISNFVYLGHSTIGTFEVGYEGSNQSFKAKDFNASAFEKSAEINLVGGCRTAVNRTFLGLTLSKSLVQQFSEILSKNATIYGSSTRVYYSGGVISDKKLLNKFGGSIIEKKERTMKRNRKIFASIFILFGLSVVLYIYYIFNPFTFLKKNCDIEPKFYYLQDSRKVEPLKTIIDFNDRNTYYIVLHINPFELYLLPDSIKKFPILYLKDKKDVELFIKEFKFEWDGYSFYETTDSFKNNLFIIKNGEVFCSLICSLTYEGFSVFSDKTGWIFPTNQKKL